MIEVVTAGEVTVAAAAKLTGLSDKAIRRKIESGVWLEGREFHRRQNSIFIDIKGYSSWVTGRV